MGTGPHHFAIGRGIPQLQARAVPGLYVVRKGEQREIQHIRFAVVLTTLAMWVREKKPRRLVRGKTNVHSCCTARLRTGRKPERSSWREGWFRDKKKFFCSGHAHLKTRHLTAAVVFGSVGNRNAAKPCGVGQKTFYTAWPIFLVQRLDLLDRIKGPRGYGWLVGLPTADLRLQNSYYQYMGRPPVPWDYRNALQRDMFRVGGDGWGKTPNRRLARKRGAGMPIPSPRTYGNTTPMNSPHPPPPPWRSQLVVDIATQKTRQNPLPLGSGPVI